MDLDIHSLRELAERLQFADIDAIDEHDLIALTNVVRHLDIITNQIRRVKAERVASVKRMTNFIAEQIMPAEKKEKSTMKKASLLPGGAESAVRRRAGGKCELCGAEYHLNVHHVIPRVAGGLDHNENLILLCRRCHNNVEDQGYTSRSELLRREIARPVITAEAQKSRVEKAAETRAANMIERAHEADELTAWDVWAPMTARTVPILTMEQAAQIKQPEKPWHVIVYGAGRHMP